jgi:hypothetical protein
MKFSSMRSAVVIASVIVGSVIPSQAFAEIDVLTGLNGVGSRFDRVYESVYVFNQSMILNSIGFVSNSEALSTVSYTLNGTLVTLNQGMLGDVDSNGLKWYTLANGGVSVSDSTVLKVTTRGSLNSFDFGDGLEQVYKTYSIGVGSINNSSNVDYSGMTEIDTNFGHIEDRGITVTNSNLRVSNPGSNVAPEPGSFALALTGGAALAGIALRRRRNAG